VHCAALLGALSPIEHYDVPTWCRVLHVNLTAAFALTQLLLPALRVSEDASIVFTSSGVARRPRAYWGAYAASKAGIEALSAMLAQEMQDSSAVRVNVLNPGPVRTRMRAQAFPAEDPRGLAAPADIVAPYLWLLGSASRGVTGQSLECQAARPAPPG
jgi:NAD(P)-dependent dehydrogenase (short-subunit alcohol dehydrogenase family)